MKSLSADFYCYPNTTVLRNLEGIEDAGELDAFEAAMVAVGIARFEKFPISGPFDQLRLLETHRRIFGKVYPWAGQLRRDTGTMTKKRSAGNVVLYGDSAFIESGLRDVLMKLQSENFLRQLDSSAFAVRAAFFYGELDAVHPFREGNSRTLRRFFGDLARDAGYEIDWESGSTTQEQRDEMYFARDMAVMRGDSSGLARLIAKHLIKL